LEIDAVHATEGGAVALVDLFLEVGLVGEELGAIVAVDGEGFEEGCFGDYLVVDASDFEEAG
jgi:hypothetical protein